VVTRRPGRCTKVRSTCKNLGRARGILPSELIVRRIEPKRGELDHRACSSGQRFARRMTEKRQRFLWIPEIRL
jgi:hypothetical protein